VLADLHPEDALETNDVAVEEISLKVIREMAAGDQAGAGAGTRGALPELLHLSVFRRVIKMTAESRSEEGFVAGRIGNQIGAPVIELAAVRVGEAVGNVTVELVGARLETVDARVGVAHRPHCGLNLRAMEDPVAEIRRAARIEHHRVG